MTLCRGKGHIDWFRSVNEGSDVELRELRKLESGVSWPTEGERVLDPYELPVFDFRYGASGIPSVVGGRSASALLNREVVGRNCDPCFPPPFALPAVGTDGRYRLGAGW